MPQTQGPQRSGGVARRGLVVAIVLATLLFLATTCLGGWFWWMVLPTARDHQEQATDSPDGAYRAYVDVREGFLNNWYSLHVQKLRTGADATVTDRACYEIQAIRWSGPRLLEVQFGRARYPDCQPLPSHVFDVELRAASW